MSCFGAMMHKDDEDKAASPVSVDTKKDAQETEPTEPTEKGVGESATTHDRAQKRRSDVSVASTIRSYLDGILGPKTPTPTTTPPSPSPSPPLSPTPSSSAPSCPSSPLLEDLSDTVEATPRGLHHPTPAPVPFSSDSLDSELELPDQPRATRPLRRKPKMHNMNIHMKYGDDGGHDPSVPRYINPYLGREPAGNDWLAHCSVCRAPLPEFYAVARWAWNKSRNAFCPKHECGLASCMRQKKGTHWCVYHTCKAGCGDFVGDGEHEWWDGNCENCACSWEKGCGNPRVEGGMGMCAAHYRQVHEPARMARAKRRAATGQGMRP